MPRLRLHPFWIVAVVGLSATAQAQDPFEIHVYEYETLKPGQFTLEQHLNYWAIGPKQSDGTVAPTNDQFHMTYEITGGITRQISLGFMQLSGVRPGGSGLEYAGWRLLPHFYAPKSWHLPVALGLVAELSLVRPIYAADTRHIEIRPIVERRIGPVQLDFNPVFARSLRGIETRDGWQFEPAAREPPMAILIRAGWSLTLSGTANLAHCGALLLRPHRFINCSPV